MNGSINYESYNKRNCCHNYGTLKNLFIEKLSLYFICYDSAEQKENRRKVSQHITNLFNPFALVEAKI